MEQKTSLYNPDIHISRRNEAFYYLGFLVWPFGVLIAALKHWERPWSKNVFWIFCVFFGYTFIIAENTINAADSARYAQALIEYSRAQMKFGELWRSFYSESSAYVDIAQPLITWFVSRFTENPHILFAVFAMIFGFFHSRNIWYVLDRTNGKITITGIFFILTFVLLNPIWNINGVRMWTAAQIFLYGTLAYMLEGNPKKLIWSGISVLFHFSFIIPLAVLFLFLLLKNRITIYLGFFILTSFIKEINLEAVQSYLSFLPGVFQSRISGYTNLDYAASLSSEAESLNWYIPFSSAAVGWVIYVMILFIYFFCRKFMNDRQDLMKLFCFSLLLYSFANIFSLVPSGGRFLVVASSFIFALFTVFIATATGVNGLGIIRTLSIFLLSFYCLITIRMGMDYYGFMTIIGNPILAAFYTDTEPLIAGIKSLF